MWLALAGCFPSLVSETPHINGSVVSAATNLPISGATLRYRDFPEIVGTTEADGSFEFPAIRKWEIVVLLTDHIPARGLNIAAQGFEPAHITIYIGGPASYTIRLEPSQL